MNAKNRRHLLAVSIVLTLVIARQTGPAFSAQPAPLDSCNVVWDSPSPDASGSMPLGNGDIGLNAWIEPSGDVLFYISKTDAWGDNARLLKVGRVRVHFDPSPLVEGETFQQTLALQEGTMVVRFGEGSNQTTVRLWVDANHPVVHLDLEGRKPRTATAAIELWRTEPLELPSIETSDVNLDRSRPNDMHAPTIVEPDVVLTGQVDRIGWYHHNKKSVGPARMAQIQGLDGFKRVDPLLHRTFGAVVTAENGKPVDDLHLQSSAANDHRLSVYVLAEHPASPDQWLAAVDRLIAEVNEHPWDARRQAHLGWWSQFWARSWIHVTRSGQTQTPTVIPANDHPLIAGRDQHGGSRFQGEFGRISLLGRALSNQELAELAARTREETLPKSQDWIGSWTEFAGPELNAKAADLTRSLTVEAWIRLEENDRGGRIVDKVTPGGGDGFLLDTWPGRSLRLIAGRETLSAKNCLEPGRWQHVAAVVDAASGSLQLWRDGQLLAENGMLAGDDAAIVSRAYALQRFIDACAGRGCFPIKFNGSIFTVPYPGQPGDADYRRWGPGYWWQNTRLPYMSMCASGDFEMMRPLFRMYAEDLMPLFKYRTRRYFDHDGAFIPECIMFWGDVFSETYGWTPFDDRGDDKLQTSGWHKWEWVSGPELVWMMLDYYDHTLDDTMLKKTLLPAAHEILAFFDQHYGVDENGKLVMHPSQSLETWWDCTNPMPELAGLHAVTDRLLALPETLTSPEQRTFWTALKAKLPPLPTREVDGVGMLAPAERFENKRNIENPELYAVFPFRLVAVGRPDIELGIEALHHRGDRGHFGWRQDDIFMAYLGLADDAKKNLVARARMKDKGSRFPAFWGPNYDWVPDQDHGGVLMKALQSMVLQTDGDKIYLLPAWPRDWNVSFKLHAPKRTLVEVAYRDGRIESLQVAPQSRRNDVVFPPEQPPDK
jgi:hypothetical protein